MPADRVLRRSRLAAGLAAGLMLALAVACAPKAPPPMPGTLAHPDYVYPAVPPALQASPGASRVDVGWRYLQSGDTRNADLEFGVALKLAAGLYPARAGQGYAALARGDHERALSAFDAALTVDAAYAPALVGRGQALLALDRSAAALEAFEQALAADASLASLRPRVEVLRFRAQQELVDAARSAATAGRFDEARRAYERALAGSPDSAFLYRELGLLERRAGDAERALERLRRAVTLDPGDASSLVAMGDLLEARDDHAGAEAAFRQAAALDPGLDLGVRIAAAGARAREATLPPQFRAALTAPQITRGDLAAMVGVRLEDVLRRAPASQVVVTDAQGSWAAAWIAQVASTGVIEPFANHTFQPQSSVRRGDLATVVSRLVALVAPADPALRARLAQRPAITDVAPGHVQYDAVASAVAAGVLPLVDGRFLVTRQVSGAEAAEAIDRVRALAGSSQSRP